MASSQVAFRSFVFQSYNANNSNSPFKPQLAMWSPAIIFAIFTTLSAAKDCAFYWSYPSGVYDKWALGRIDEAVGICATEIGGHVLVPDMDVQNGDNKANRCTVCRGARSGTEDFVLDYFTVRCGYFGDGSCSA
ncbi:hypothetical protein COL154_003640 [Colletotrichum chrysophilum]|uniref:Uncharacterized protein n=1 Tax=Colletotrichum chrysophilum TaxID=1836956 RepID=A0AAD9AZ07_9PEZI|nr:uncharacterized protein COL26b_002908 [Colletotrichum chrysophilum]KAJ0352836.1 hypothetical protein KNSL1_002416 [Colletotrichum chrysophilum]KAJ0366760.1 hypothetical protein COL154_003640 [Colletotrichum chrysophilum]KAJ0378843.1 hypothetical protein COL26b_002908 [Colletotrichum chrysophilum]KAK1856147.1 hypothetical protein CCHR01_01212 [Colletotrichum chrysophilum]